ncbi:MAG: SDR family NAD(P)-dependent oxidoreductase [Acidimicrobiales bacterium]
MNDSLGQPQSVLVLGGSSDIGGAVVKALIAGRARSVLLAGRGAGQPGPLEDAAQQARALGATSVLTFEWDVTDVDAQAETLGDIFAHHEIDLVLMAVGILGDQADIELHPSQAHPIINANFAGPAVACLVSANCLRTQGHGVLVVLSSVAGELVRRDNFVYGSAKAGLDGFALGLDDSLSGSGARVMVVRPGFVHTRMTRGMSAAPFATGPDEVAKAVVSGLGRRDRIVWAPAILRPVMALLRHLPRQVIRRLPR